jgi:hypothetical protein
MNLEKEIYKEIAGCCISDESADWAAKKVIRLIKNIELKPKWCSSKKLPKNLKKHYLTYSEDCGYRILSPASTNDKFPSTVVLWMNLPKI